MTRLAERRILEVLGPSDWREVEGQRIRAYVSERRVIAIGHQSKHRWFDPIVELRAREA